MKRVTATIMIVLLVASSLFLQSCGCKTMSDEQYATISMQLALSMVGEAFSGKDEAELEKIKNQRLEELCDEAGFSKDDFDCKTEELKKRGNLNEGTEGK